MQTLLSTKLNVPPSRQQLVLRPDLTATLAKAGLYSLTLVSAPPGYGKTTLVASWLRDTSFPFAWFSLDEGDNDPVRFLDYFLTALHSVVPAIRPELMAPREGPQAFSFETLMTLLINEAAGAGDFFLILDDFHVLHASPILDMLGFLFEHLPPGMHVILLSRSDPPLALPRLRARGQLLEIRTEKLRFTRPQISQFFEQIMNLSLSTSDISAIETRTEGWIAGLQLAGLAMQTENDLQRFIAEFSGSHAYIMDYLTEEVLRGQPKTARSFLLQTSILDRMCGSLCEALVNPAMSEAIDGQVLMETVERNHLFITPLDSERRWYRYHHLFREVLSHRLAASYPEQIPALHGRASEWFEQHGLIHEAIQHALKAMNPDRTVRLVEQHGCALLMGGELATLADWLAAIDPYTLTRPWLAMQKAWVLSLSGQVDRAEMAINQGEQLISTLAPTDEVRTLRGSFSAARALWANRQGKTKIAVEYARQAIDLLGVGGDFSCALRSLATSLLGDASWSQGRLEDARRAYEEALQIGRISGNPHMTMISLNSLADVHYEQGKYHQAAGLYTEALNMADQVDGPNSAYAYNSYFGLSRIYYAWDRLEEAAVSAEKGCQLAIRWGNAALQAACLTLAAHVDLHRGFVEKAESTAVSVEDLIRDHPISPYWDMWVRASLAQFWVKLGRIEKAIVSLRDTGVCPDSFSPERPIFSAVPVDTPVPFRLVPACVVLARLYVKLGSPAAGLAICDCLDREENAWEWGRTTTELHIIRALAAKAQKDTASSLDWFEKAISLAWPEQSRRVFLDEGEPMGRLLYQAKAHGIGGEFVGELLTLMDQHTKPVQPVAAERSLAGGSRNSPKTTEAPRQQNALIEPLSARELEVLRCIAEGDSNQEIADRFVLSPLTVKRHISNIYAKLEAKSRTQAVSLARALKLIE